MITPRSHLNIAESNRISILVLSIHGINLTPMWTNFLFVHNYLTHNVHNYLTHNVHNYLTHNVYNIQGT